jgi:hypothetical protein
MEPIILRVQKTLDKKTSWCIKFTNQVLSNSVDHAQKKGLAFTEVAYVY